eukprot:gene1076-10595_t
MSSQACAYATLMLHSSDLQVTASSILDAAKQIGVKVPQYQAEAFAKSYDREAFTTLIQSMTTPGAGVSSGASSSGAATESKKEEKEEKKDESESAGGGFGDMFGGSDED